MFEQLNSRWKWGGEVRRGFFKRKKPGEIKKKCFLLFLNERRVLSILPIPSIMNHYLGKDTMKEEGRNRGKNEKGRKGSSE